MDLSVLIPSRNEIFISRTVEDIVKNIRGNTEVIVVLDGGWADPPIEDYENVHIIYNPESIGQRAATNQAARVASGKYVMKVDAHCAFDDGFDIKMLEVMQDDWTLVPIMKNLHAFDWVCPNGHRRYQSPSGVCKECGEPTEMDVVWIAKRSPSSTAYCFDKTLHFYYMAEMKNRENGKGPLSETMSLQGSCFMINKDRYFDLNICDETWGSWGNQGTEVACKSWLSGGRVLCNHNTWYAHMFRTQGGDFSFPYPQSGKAVENARQKSRDLFLENKWEKQVKPLSWLVEKFWPIEDLPNRPGWNQEDLDNIKTKPFKTPNVKTKGIVYYTDNELDKEIMKACQEQIIKSTDNKIISISLKPLDFGENICLDMERGYLSMFKQILAGLEKLDTDIVFFCEHDVLYHPSHFNFIPQDKDKIYYNINVWKLRLEDGHAIHYDCQQTSGLCAYRETLIKHYKQRVLNTQTKFDELGNTRTYRNWIRAQGFEPGTHGRPERVDDLQSESWWSEYPNIDIRHDGNLTPSRWSQDQFRSSRSCRNWMEADEVPGWDKSEYMIYGITS
jgi:glycosyltransferase involved in cell wall biosynthesis